MQFKERTKYIRYYLTLNFTYDMIYVNKDWMYFCLVLYIPKVFKSFVWTSWRRDILWWCGVVHIRCKWKINQGIYLNRKLCVVKFVMDWKWIQIEFVLSQCTVFVVGEWVFFFVSFWYRCRVRKVWQVNEWI